MSTEKKDERFEGFTPIGNSPYSNMKNPKDAKCLCEARYKDEEQKEAVMAEIYLTYEEILQLE